MDISANTVTINGKQYIEVGAAPLAITEKRIIVADKGWVFVGDCTDNSDGTVTINNARNIRVWGTTNGLGELTTGPTKNTKHDAYGTVRCTPIITIAVQSGW